MKGQLVNTWFKRKMAVKTVYLCLLVHHISATVYAKGRISRWRKLKNRHRSIKHQNEVLLFSIEFVHQYRDAFPQMSVLAVVDHLADHLPEEKRSELFPGPG